MAEFLRTFAGQVAYLAEAVGALVIAVAILKALWHYSRDFAGRADPFPREGIRLGIGRSLALALELLLAADILRTAVEPSWDEIGRLAAIAAIRTALNYFLQRELVREEARLARERAPVAAREALPKASAMAAREEPPTIDERH